MLFNSLTFVVFFVVVVTAYWSIRSWNARKNLLVVASYMLYGAWNPPFAALLFSTTAMDFWLGRQMRRAKGRRSRRAWLVASVCMNLSMLGFFKYGNFLLQNFQWLLARMGIIYQPPHLDILLPVGISFYTFHSLSYTLDIYRGVLKPTKSLRDFVLAVSFFPQLVAGPIVRAGDFLLRFLPPLAYLAFHILARLPLYSSWRQPGSSGACGHESGHRHVSRRPLARRGLDICRLGLASRFLSRGRTGCSRFVPAQGMGEPSRDSTPWRVCHLRCGLHRLGIFSSIRFHRRCENVGRHVWWTSARRCHAFYT